jgi:hypothetical protein
MLQVGALSVATFIAIFLLADRLPDSWLHVIGRAGPGVAKAVAGVLAVVVFMAAVAATCSALTGVSLAQYGRVVVGADCATLPAIMGSAGSLQPETSDAWGAGALKYRWQGRSLLANAEVTCLQGRVSTKTQDGLRSTTELTVWGTVLGLFGLAGLLLWAALKGRTQRIPARRRAQNAAAMLASWLVAFAVAGRHVNVSTAFFRTRSVWSSASR